MKRAVESYAKGGGRLTRLIGGECSSRYPNSSQDGNRLYKLLVRRQDQSRREVSQDGPQAELPCNAGVMMTG